MKMNQKGFSLIEGLLIVIALSLVGFVGFYVYNANKDEKKNEHAAVTHADEKGEKAEDETANWQELASSKGAFKLKVPDGWKLNNDPTQDFVSSSLDPADITYKKGVAPVLTQDEILGTDAPYRFVVSVSSEAGESGESAEFVLADGTKGGKSTEEFEDMVGNAGIIKVHTYMFGAADKVVTVRYSVLEGDPDNIEIVEKVIKTLQF